MRQVLSLIAIASLFAFASCKKESAKPTVTGGYFTTSDSAQTVVTVNTGNVFDTTADFTVAATVTAFSSGLDSVITVSRRLSSDQDYEIVINYASSHTKALAVSVTSRYYNFVVPFDGID